MRFVVLFHAVVLPLCFTGSVGADSVEERLKAATTAYSLGKINLALTEADRAIVLDPKRVEAYLIRSRLHEALQQHKEAVADYDKVIELDPKNADAYDRRGSEKFKLGKIDESIKDFDAYLKLNPQAEPGHWRRGIAYYYARRFAEGRKQFEGYESVDRNDVENVVWRYICMAQVDGVEKARKAILKVGFDRRIPMMTVYDLFAGKAKPADVLEAARAHRGKPAEMTTQLFYAHLYLGLYYEAAGDEKSALTHIRQAAEDHKIPGYYMWDVARVHYQLLQQKQKGK